MVSGDPSGEKRKLKRSLLLMAVMLMAAACSDAGSGDVADELATIFGLATDPECGVEETSANECNIIAVTDRVEKADMTVGPEYEAMIAFARRVREFLVGACAG